MTKNKKSANELRELFDGFLEDFNEDIGNVTTVEEGDAIQNTIKTGAHIANAGSLIEIVAQLEKLNYNLARLADKL